MAFTVTLCFLRILRNGKVLRRFSRKPHHLFSNCMLRRSGALGKSFNDMTVAVASLEITTGKNPCGIFTKHLVHHADRLNPHLPVAVVDGFERVDAVSNGYLIGGESVLFICAGVARASFQDQALFAQPLFKATAESAQPCVPVRAISARDRAHRWPKNQVVPLTARREGAQSAFPYATHRPGVHQRNSRLPCVFAHRDEALSKRANVLD